MIKFNIGNKLIQFKISSRIQLIGLIQCEFRLWVCLCSGDTSKQKYFHVGSWDVLMIVLQYGGIWSM